MKNTIKKLDTKVLGFINTHPGLSKAVLSCAILAFIMILSPDSIFAGDLIGTAKHLLSTVWGMIYSLAAGVVFVLGTIALLLSMTAKDPRKAGEYLDWFKRIVATFIGILLFGSVVVFIQANVTVENPIDSIITGSSKG